MELLGWGTTLRLTLVVHRSVQPSWHAPFACGSKMAMLEKKEGRPRELACINFVAVVGRE